jgi:hypothetical protein
MKRLYATFNTCKIDLNRQCDIVCNDGMTRKATTFKVDCWSKSGKSVDIIFYNGNIAMTTLRKKVIYKNENMYIKVNGNEYNIGEYYEEV